MSRTLCEAHSAVITDVARACESYRHIEEVLKELKEDNRRLRERFAALEKRVYLLSGAIGVVSALAVTALRPVLGALIPSARADVGGVVSMEGIEPSSIDLLIEAINGKGWPIAVGVVLMILVVIARGVTRERLSEASLRIVSASSAVISAIAAMLIAGVPPTKALLVGLLASPASSGFLDMLRGVLPPKKPGGGSGAITVVLVAMALLPGLAGCGASARCMAERTTLLAAQAASEVAISQLSEGSEERTLAEEYQATSVKIAESAVEACETARDESWLDMIGIALKATAGVAGLLELAGVDVPDALSDVLERLSPGD